MTDIEREIGRKKYPHMVRAEIAIWKKFLKKYGTRFDRYQYDIHVGKGVGRIPGYSKKDQDMFIRLTQKRIDVVAYKGSTRFIVEIKERAGTSAIGQLISYRRLYMAKHNLTIPPGLAIVAESIDPDVREVAQAMRIEIVLV